MAKKGTHWRQHQKLLKIFERLTFKKTWEFQVLKTIHMDMKKIRCRRSRMWPFTSYSPYPHLKSIPGDMSDVSCEELRYLKYTSSEDEYVEYEKLLEEDYETMRERFRSDRNPLAHRVGENDVCLDADDIMMYLVNEVYISESKDTNTSCLKMGRKFCSRYYCVAILPGCL